MVNVFSIIVKIQELAVSFDTVHCTRSSPSLPQVTELLIRHGANVNAMDLWQFTPLHEAASKGRSEVCSLLLSHGADPLALNCHAKSAIDVSQTQDLKDRLLAEFRGHTLLEACRQVRF